MDGTGVNLVNIITVTPSTLLTSLVLTMAVQGNWETKTLLPPSLILHWTLDIWTPVSVLVCFLVVKVLLAAAPFAELLLVVDGVLPVKRFQLFWGRLVRTIKMSKGYEKDLLPYITKVLPHILTMVENVDYVEPIFPVMVQYMPIFGPHLDVVLPNLGSLGPHLSVMMPFMPELEPHMEVFLPNLPGVLPHLGPMMKHMDSFLPYLGTICPNLPILIPHMGPMMLHVESFLPHLPVIMRNFHYVLPHLPLFLHHIDALLPTLDKTMVHMDGMAPHFDAMAPSLPKFIPIMDRVVDHLPAIIPRLGDTLLNADAVLDYLGWTVKTPLVKSLEMHGTGSTVVKISRAMGGKKKSENDMGGKGGNGMVRRNRHASEVAISLRMQTKISERIVLEGWLKKRSTSALLNSLAGKSWKRKWIVIDVSGCMSVYKSPSKSTPSLRARMFLGGSEVKPQRVGKSFQLVTRGVGERGKKYTHFFRIPKGEDVEGRYWLWFNQLKSWEGSGGGKEGLVEEIGLEGSGGEEEEEEEEEESEEEEEENEEEEMDDAFGANYD
ncbi:hypothetical protein TrCOL_g7152 [Triparma columacea]|uniref:PH domain-containing protein n=1 Tax=Triparma columacea TaxID=722753 RepID=A0A9W7GJU6_9STRA|nr:hypothetical protein TrCOL_g7152 [Triparma columacea]